MGPVIVLEPRPNPGSLSPRQEPKPEGCSHTWIASCHPCVPGSLRGKAHLRHAAGLPTRPVSSWSLQPLGPMRLLLPTHQLSSLPGEPLSPTPAWFASCLLQVLATCCLSMTPTWHPGPPCPVPMSLYASLLPLVSMSYGSDECHTPLMSIIRQLPARTEGVSCLFCLLGSSKHRRQPLVWSILGK